MIPTLIFSKDRPMQLDALLTSMEKRAPFLDPFVLWRATNEATRQGYGLASKYHRPKWCEERDFGMDVTLFVSTADGPICFLVDDDLFYADAPEPEPLPYSFRPGSFEAAGDWSQPYPFTLDGGVYDPAEVLPLLDFHFTDPTRLEAGVASSITLPWLRLNHGGGCLVGIPANRVSESSGMPHMGGDPMQLTTLFLDGWRIDVDATLDGWQIVSNHMEIPYRFRRA